LFLVLFSNPNPNANPSPSPNHNFSPWTDNSLDQIQLFVALMENIRVSA